MKKIISAIFVCMFLLGALLALSSCGNTIYGTYAGEVDVLVAKYKVTYVFEGNNVTVTSKLSVALGSVESNPVEGTYAIGEDEDGNRTITFDYSGHEEAKGAAEEGIALSFNQGKDDNGKYIEIAGVRLYEVK